MSMQGRHGPLHWNDFTGLFSEGLQLVVGKQGLYMFPPIRLVSPLSMETFPALYEDPEMSTWFDVEVRAGCS